MTIKQIEKSFESFLHSDDAVLVVRGNWGVGKTYFWKKFIKEHTNTPSLKQVAYSYISLFGKTSLAEVRASIFQSGVPLAPDAEIQKQFQETYDESTKLLKSVPWLDGAKTKLSRKVRIARWITDLARSTPYTDKYARLIATLEYKLVNNYLICFDDLERKGAGLSIREVMGLIDELANDKRCKVVLIFNDQSLTKSPDKEEFDEYREKVVDIEIEYAPDHLQALECALPVDDPLFREISRLTQALDIKNIRVLRKLRKLVDAFAPALNGKDQRITAEFLNHAAVLSWSYYMRKDALPHEFMLQRTQQSSLSFLLKKEEEISENERRYRKISHSIGLSPSIFTPLIDKYLEKGFLDDAEVEREVIKLQQETEKLDAHNQINAVWRMYQDSFTDNADEIRMKMHCVLEQHFDKLSLRDFAVGLELISELGGCVNSLIDKCVQVHAERLSHLDPEEAYFVHEISYAPLRDRIIVLVGKCDDRTIDKVVEKIAFKRGWNDNDVKFLASLTPDQLKAWMLSAPDDLPIKIRHGLLDFGQFSGGHDNDKTASYSRIHRSTVKALNAIGNTSKLNRLRISTMYGIKETD